MIIDLVSDGGQRTLQWCMAWAFPSLTLIRSPHVPVASVGINRAERAERAAIAMMGAQRRLAVDALIVELARIRRHRFLLGEAAVRGRSAQSRRWFRSSRCHFRTVDGKPPYVVARVNASGLVLSGSYVS
jgi:hypothetical protein